MLFPPFPFPTTPPRVVVTGAGIITALGRGWDINAAGFRAGRRAFRPVTHFDVSRQRVKTAAEVDLPEIFPTTKLSASKLNRLDRAGKMLLLAALEAWQQSGWTPHDHYPLVLGTTAGGMTLGEAYYRQALATTRKRRGQATRAVQYQAHAQAGAVLAALGCNGPATIISNACASGGNAIGHAFDLIRNGQAEQVLAGGYDAVGELVFSGFDSLQALSPTTCRPFDAQRDGLALGEGAAVLTLESLDRARQRGAEILGEIAGYATAIDHHHLTQPQPQGNTTLKVMVAACADARVSPSDVDYLNAHGTGTPLNDSSEALAISEWAGARAATLPVSSTKASIGHLLGGAGAVEGVISLMTLREQWLPPEIEFETPDPACRFPIVQKPRDGRVNVVLSNSFGFGGVNAVLIFRRWA
jgi:3-oxoacyl-[acyl-carrier-protein] synthase II